MTYLKDVAEYEVTQADVDGLVEMGFLEIEDDRGRVKATIEIEDFEVDEEPEPEGAENDDESDAEAPVDPSDLTIAELETELAERDLSESDLQALAAAEEDGDDRNGALEAITEEIGATRAEE